VESWPIGLTSVMPYRPRSLAHLDRAQDPLAAEPPGAVLTLPAPATEQQEDRTEARWLLRALSHGHPVTGGVTGWVPPRTVALRERLERVLVGAEEVEAVIDDLRAQGVRYVELATADVEAGLPRAAARWRAILAAAGYPESAWRPSVSGYEYLVLE
jgi:hypothetical protein